MIAHESGPPEDRESDLGTLIRSWMDPEIADYEVRREPLRVRRTSGIARLDALITQDEHLAVTTSAMRQTATSWAEARQQPTHRTRSLRGNGRAIKKEATPRLPRPHLTRGAAGGAEPPNGNVDHHGRMVNPRYRQADRLSSSPSVTRISRMSSKAARPALLLGLPSLDITRIVFTRLGFPNGHRYEKKG